MPEPASNQVESRTRNPFDVPKGRWKVYAALTIVALISSLIGILLGSDITVMISLMAAFFLGVGVVYSFMNERGL